MRKIFFMFFLMLATVTTLLAQGTGATPPAPKGIMESEGKIYVVMAVCLVILTGLFGYLFMLDRRITKLEQKKD